MWSAKNIYRRQSWVYDTVGHAPLAIDRLLDVRKTPSYRRPCSVDRTVGDAPSNVCLWRPAAWTNTPKRTEKNLIVRSGISEAETTNNKTALDVLYTDTKHRAASLRQQRSSLCCVYCYDAKIAKTTVNYTYQLTKCSMSLLTFSQLHVLYSMSVQVILMLLLDLLCILYFLPIYIEGGAEKMDHFILLLTCIPHTYWKFL